MTGFVYIIGAGCGSADLITVRGMNALKKCDTVVYDALIDTELLTYTSDGAEIIPVGKRSGAHAAKQEDINALLVEKALAGRTVARLKGGDPF
ncbi:MAG TPA: uroporphyrin-III C-methyltransferase, partial [Ruminococcaceae bacterium]|nr:uroporphyrin-III C-methyltransferase [Oscillospiraceae bacterium]